MPSVPSVARLVHGFTVPAAMSDMVMLPSVAQSLYWLIGIPYCNTVGSHGSCTSTTPIVTPSSPNIVYRWPPLVCGAVTAMVSVTVLALYSMGATSVNV